MEQPPLPGAVVCIQGAAAPETQFGVYNWEESPDYIERRTLLRLRRCMPRGLMPARIRSYDAIDHGAVCSNLALM